MTTSLERVKRFIANNPDRWREMNRSNVSRFQKRKTAFNRECKRLRNIGLC